MVKRSNDQERKGETGSWNEANWEVLLLKNGIKFPVVITFN